MVLLETRAGSSFIRKDVIPAKVWNKIKPSRNVNVRDANNRKLHTNGTIKLFFEVENKVALVTVNIVEHLATILLGCEYFDPHVEAIKPRQRIVELEEGTAVPIIRNAGGRIRNVITLPEVRKFPKGAKRASTGIRVSQKVILKLETQNVVDVITDQKGSIVVEPSSKLFESNMCLIATDVT